MKNLLFTLLALFTVNISFSQFWEEEEGGDGVDYNSNDYDVLRVLWADESYEKLLKVAEKYTMKDDSKNDAEPYLWLAKGLYAMSKDENYTNQDKYKKAYNDALTWLGKYYKKEAKIKKDMLKALTEESTAEDSAKINGKSDLYIEHIEFFIEVKKSLYEMIDSEIASGGYAKAIGLISKMAKVTPDNFAKDFLIGACNFQKGDKTTARDNWKNAEAELKKLKEEDFLNWEKPDKMFLALGIVESGKCHVKSKKPEVAKALMKDYLSWFEDFEFFAEYYEEI
jgi:hypothetical protein